MFYSGEQRASNSAIFTWLASTKARRHVLTKALELYFQKSLMNYTVFARANSHDKVSTTNKAKTKTFVTKKQLTKFSHVHEQIRFAIENLLVCIGLWALQHHRQASHHILHFYHVFVLFASYEDKSFGVF